MTAGRCVPKRLRPEYCAAQVSMIIFALTLWYNALITNNPLQFPFHYYAPTEAIGFGLNGYTPALRSPESYREFFSFERSSLRISAQFDVRIFYAVH